ncbi:MAG: hypothetical protein HYT50_00910 [Candidatus Wildermuthbacteria bacterium]|nr:hypothetical protein [Candidatus Wildermuthbacteria bacterium]
MSKFQVFFLCVAVFLCMAIVMATTAAPLSALSTYFYSFNFPGKLQEASSLFASSSPYWWVNSGAYLDIYAGRGHTQQGSLPFLDPWRVLYAKNNPADTDQGYHPQNIFRLIGKSKWQNASQEAFFLVAKDNLSQSSNRNASNGILLLNRYQDGNNLYYAGVRVDGAAVIKKKQNGAYTTLSYVKGVYPGTYDRTSNPNLLPKNKWIGIKSETQNNADGSLTIRLYIDKGWTGSWELVAQATDTRNPITSAGYGGIRTDFMDAAFENYQFVEL